MKKSNFVSEVRADIVKLIGRRSIEDGIELTDKSKGIGRNVIKLNGRQCSHILVSLSITASYSEH